MQLIIIALVVATLILGLSNSVDGRVKGFFYVAAIAGLLMFLFFLLPLGVFI